MADFIRLGTASDCHFPQTPHISHNPRQNVPSVEPCILSYMGLTILYQPVGQQEYDLIEATGFRRFRPPWDRYARMIDAGFTQLNSVNLTAAIDYLLGQPPKKQVLVNGKLQWRDAPPDANVPRAEQVLLMVRRVRNNLFHGGKFLPTGARGDRDQLLVNHALVVLHACLPLNADVAAAYAS